MTENPDRRKLNDVFSRPIGNGGYNICGFIGSGKTQETVILNSNVDLNDVTSLVYDWRNHRGELWRNLKPLTEVE